VLNDPICPRLLPFTGPCNIFTRLSRATSMLI